MLLEEVKRLKVVELRAMLKERGLEAKGLKAELVVRLFSAIEAGNKPIESGDNVENVCNETSTEPTARLSLQRELCGGTPAPVCASSSSNTSMKAFTDQSTQTDPQRLCVCNATDPRATAKPLTARTSQAGEMMLQQTNLQQSDLAPAVAEEENAVSGATSSVLGISASGTPQEQELDGLQTVDSTTEESRELTRPCEEKGRDYYEFKEDIHYNRAKTPEPLPEPMERVKVDFEDVQLDSYNCDLHFEVGPDGSSGQPLFWEKFPLLWSGCRMTHGFCLGKAGFEAKFMKRLPAPALEMNDDPDPYVLRVGWSVDNTSLQLGEVALSYGFDGRGRIVTGGREEAFGEPFTEGDAIGCYAFLKESGEATLSFYKNGRSLGVAFHLNSSILGGQALYPHVLCKNCSVSVNPGTPWYPFPAGFCTLSALPYGQKTHAPLPAASKSECEVLMMVGMPGSGKTHWAHVHMLENPMKRYNLLSTNSIMSCMRDTVGADLRDLKLQHATQCVSQLIKIAAAKGRNFILDQANIYPSAQRHKMLCFHGYQRKAVVVLPPDEVWRRRLSQRHKEEGIVIQETSLLKAKVSFTVPKQGEHLEEVMFVELSSDEALNLLTQYKEEARQLLPKPPKSKKHRQGRRGGPFSCHNNYASQKSHSRPYGCSSDPQRYRNYYRPYSGQWNLNE